MAVIGTLAVSLTANTSRFSKGMKRGIGVVGTFATSVRNLTRRVFGLGSALAGLVAGAAFTQMVRSSLQTIDAQTKLAKRLEVSTEFISGLGFAAEQTGTDFNLLTTAISALTRRIGNAAAIGGVYDRTLRGLGLNTQRLARMRPDEVFLRVADAIAGLESPAAKFEAAQQLFSTQGRQLVNLLNEGRGGIVGMIQEADRLGITFDRLAGTKVELANDAFNRLRHSLRGVFNAIAIELTPGIVGLSETLTRTITETGNLRQRLAGAFESSALFAARLVEVVDDIVRGFKQASIVISKVIETVARGERLVSFGAGADFLDQLIADEQNAQENLRAALDKPGLSLVPSVREFFAAFEEGALAAAGSTGMIAPLLEDAVEQAAALESRSMSIADAIAAVGNVKPSTFSLSRSGLDGGDPGFRTRVSNFESRRRADERAARAAKDAAERDKLRNEALKLIDGELKQVNAHLLGLENSGRLTVIQ